MEQKPVAVVLKKGSQIPTQKYESDACWDIEATSIKIVSGEVDKQGKPKGDYIQYGTGIFSEIPKGYYIDIHPRSSIRDKDLIMTNADAVIDAHYRGEWLICFKVHGMVDIKGTLMQLGILSNLSKEPLSNEILINGLKTCGVRIYEIGERIAQVRLEEKIPTKWIEVDELSETDRGSGGHGSTGK